MSIRATFGGAIALLLVAGAVVSGRPLEARALGGINSVTVSPGHGRAAAAFAVTYTVSPCVGLASLTIGFSWGALAPAGPVLGTAATDSACRATLSTTPPVNAASHQPPAPGTYQVFGYIALPTGTPTPGTEVSAAYTVDAAPTATATAQASATAHASATARTSATANPSASGNPSASASAPAPSIQTSSAASVGVGQAVTGTNGQRGNSTWTWWLVPALILLALAILALIAAIIAWLVRWRRERAAGIGKDRAA